MLQEINAPEEELKLVQMRCKATFLEMKRQLQMILPAIRKISDNAHYKKKRKWVLDELMFCRHKIKELGIQTEISPPDP
jgi:hypothetical protein